MDISKKTAPEQKNYIYGIYTKNVFSMKVLIHITEVGKNLKKNLEKKIVNEIEGKCIVQGFIKPKSVRVLSYSAGNVKGAYIQHTCVVEALVTHPVEGMIIECKTTFITKAGISAVKIDDGITVLEINIPKDLNVHINGFETVKENQEIKVKVIVMPV